MILSIYYINLSKICGTFSLCIRYLFNSAFFITLQEIFVFIGLICSLFSNINHPYFCSLLYFIAIFFFPISFTLFFCMLFYTIPLNLSPQTLFLIFTEVLTLLSPTTSHDDLISIMVCLFSSTYLVCPLPGGHSSPSAWIICFCKHKSLVLPWKPCIVMVC